MGQEIVYCHSCQSRLIGSDFDRGKAFRIEHKCLCADCAKKILDSLPPRERDAFAAHMSESDPRRTLSQKIPAIRSASESGSHARLRPITDSTVSRGVPTAPQKKSSAALYAGAGLGGAALVLLLVVVATGRNSPPPPAPVVDRPKDVVPPPTARDAEAKTALEEALKWSESHPLDFDGQVDRLQKVALFSDGTTVYPRAKSELDGARDRAHQTVLRDSVRLDEQIKNATPDAARRVLEEARRRYVSRAWDDAVRRRLDALAAAPPADPWVVLDLQSAASAKGASLEKKPDGSLLVGGPNPLTDVFILTARSPLKAVAALRLEALPDPSLPAGGPGRAANGNLVLSEIRVEAGGRPVVFSGASAGYEQDRWPASAAIDGNPLTGWGIMPRSGQASVAYFHPREPFDGTSMTITLENLSLNHQHVIGRFRLSASATPLNAAPEPRPLEDMVAATPLLLSGDGLGSGWSNLSWDSKIDFQSAAVPALFGETSIAYQPGRNGAGLYVAKPQTIDASAYAYLSFAVYRLDESQFPYSLIVVGDPPMKEAVSIPFAEIGRPPPRQWTRYVLPLQRFKLPGNKFRGVVLQGLYPKADPPAVHLDQIQLLAGPVEAPPPVPTPPHVAAYHARWGHAAVLAAAREIDAAIKALKDGAVPPDDLQKEMADDLADLQLLKTLHEETRALLAKWPRGWNISADVLDEAGKRMRLDEPVLRVDGQRLELRGGRVLESGRILAASLAEVFLARPKKLESDARAAALLCLLEGDTAAAKRIHPGALPDKTLAHAAGVPDEADARRLYLEAEAEYAGYATRTRSLEKFVLLLKDHAGTLTVRRMKASLQARLDGSRDLTFGPADLAASGKLLLQRHAKGELAWTMPEDVAAPLRKENALTLEYSAPSGAEVRGWALVGGCCLETFAFHLQGSDVEGPDPGNPSVTVKFEIDGPAALPVLATGVTFLRKTHQAHGGGKKETARFDWVALPPLKRAGPGTQARLRILADQQGFAVAAVVLSTSRKLAPKDAEFAELLAARPIAEPDAGGFGKTGGAFREFWTGIGGDSVGELLNNPKYKGAPDRAERIGAFESNGLGDGYGIRVRAWIVPPQSGPYVFSLISDDHSELWVSTDDTPGARQKIASRGGACGWDDWNGASKSSAVTLARGRRYYIEAFQKQGNGTEHLRVGWQLPDGSQERPLPGHRLIPWSPGAASRAGATLDLPPTHPAGTPLPVAVSLAGVTSGARVEIFNGPLRLGEPKGATLVFTWAQPALGAHVLSARVTERGGRVLVSPPAVVVVGDLHFFRALDFNGVDVTIDDRLWTGATGGQGFERQDLDLRPPTDPARARMIRSSVTGKVVIPDMPGGKFLVYATLWEPGEPQAVEITLNGKPVASQKFSAAGDWARLGPFAAEAILGKIELGMAKGHLSGLEFWSTGPLAPTKRTKTDLLGGGGGGAFEENPEGSPFLVGFRLTQNNGHVRSLQGLYRSGERLIEGERSGTPNGAATEILAKPGYAVGGLRVRGGDRVRAFKVVFLRIAGPLLSTSDPYESDWYVGDENGTVLLAGDGAPVVGLHGRRGNDLDSLGLTILKP